MIVYLAPTEMIGVLIVSYLIGSIPSGMIIAKIMGLGNLRDIGSGNIGATNVLRTGSKLAAFLTLVFDMMKGAVPVLLFGVFYEFPAAQIAGLGAFIGHLYPVWLKFKGGKGVATFLGVLLAFDVFAGLATCLAWLLTAFVLRMSSASALMASLSAPAFLYAFSLETASSVETLSTVATCGFLTLVIWVKHIENIRRILRGAEPKIGQS